jgi:hypothetical protein
MVANHGASPSGRFTAVLGRSESEERLEAFWIGETFVEFEGTRGLWVFDGFREPADVVFRVALGGLDGTAAPLLPAFTFICGVVAADLPPCRTFPYDVGVSLFESTSSIKF